MTTICTPQKSTNLQDLQDYENSNLTKNERAIVDLYLKAYEINDTEKIEAFQGFGTSIRHQVMNYNSYTHGLRFGYKEVVFNKYGWIENVSFEKETISFKTEYCNALVNTITLAMGLNGKWTYGYSLNFGCAGSGCSPHVYGHIFSSRSECLAHATAYVKAEFKKASKQVHDTTNYKQKIINKVLELVQIFESKQVQLTLF